VTFKDLKKRVSLEASQEETRLFERLKGKPLWIWDKQKHKQEDMKTNGECCFNLIIGLPQKDGKRIRYVTKYSKSGLSCLF
jgi:hypothetical protein